MGNIPKLHCRQDVDTSNINEMEKIEIKYKTETKINFMYANLRSILNNNKRDEMQILVNEQKIDVLGITESWLSEEKENAEIGLPGFNLFRKDRKSRGGGVLLYIKENLISVDENCGGD